MTDVVEVTRDINSPAQRMLAAARALVVDSPAMLEIAAGELRSIKSKAKELEEERMSMTRPLDESKAKIIAKYKVPLGFLGEAEDAIKRAIGRYNAKIAEERRIAQAKADEEARKAREKLAREAAEARAKAEREAAEARRKAEEAAAAGRASEAARLAARADAKSEAAEAKAEMLTMAAQAVPTSVTLPAAPKAQGVHTTRRYTAKVIDKAALLAFVARTPMFLHLLDANQSALDAQARALKDQFAIDGCELVLIEDVRARAA